MARIRGLTQNEAAPGVREIFEAQARANGAPLNTTPIYALRPTIMEGVAALARGINTSGLLDSELKHLVSLRAALINGCPF